MPAPKHPQGHHSGSGDSDQQGTYEWRLDTGEESLPLPGEYPGEITVRIIEKPDVLWMVVEHRLEQLEAVPKNEIVALQARPGSKDAARAVEGLRLLNRLCAAAGVDATAIVDPFTIPGLLTGKRLLLTIAHKKADGVTGLVVRAYRLLTT